MNAVAPDIRPEREVAREIGHVMHRPAIIPAPAFALRLVLGEESHLLLDGRHALPAKAQSAGFQFRFGGLRQALEDALSRR
jgi:NAD dependent epimerase/dehydratase family enzyme